VINDYLAIAVGVRTEVLNGQSLFDFCADDAKCVSACQLVY